MGYQVFNILVSLLQQKGHLFSILPVQESEHK